MTKAEKTAAVAQLAKAHTDRFEKCLDRLKIICRSYNFFQLLAHFAYYDQAVLDGERNDPKYEPVEQNAAELLQALILQVPEPQLQSVLDSSPPPEILLETNSLLREITVSFGLMRLDSLSADGHESMISEMIRGHTAGVRNPGFASQIRRTMRELLAPLDAEFESRNQLKLSQLGEMFWEVASILGERLNKDFQNRRMVLRKNGQQEIVTAFLDVHPHEKSYAPWLRAEVKKSKLSLTDLKGYLWTEWDLGNFKLFMFELDDFAAAYGSAVDKPQLKRLLSTWTLALGALESQKTEHFFLANPTWRKPVIQFGPDHYLLALPSMIQSFGQQMLESLIQKDEKLWERYQSKIRPRFLERSTAELLFKALPAARVLQGVNWRDPESGTRYETDILVILDTHALIVECKAGQISERAKRGEVVRLKRDIGKLIEEPTLQGHRLSEVLYKANGEFEVEDATGVKHVIDAGKLIRISRLNVTLEYFGQVGIQGRLLRKAGILSKDLAPAATIPLHELENILDVLERPSHIFHYLHRRAELESSLDLLANEGGLLAMYLATGFDFGAFEEGDSNVLALPTLHSELDPYLMGKEINRKARKPKRRLARWWSDVLIALEKRATFGWLESSYGLLSVGYDRQRKFQLGVAKIMKEVDAKWEDPEHKNTCFLVAGSPARRVKIMCVGIKNLRSLQEQRDTVERAFGVADEKQPTSATLAIVRSATTKTYPYSAVYFLLSPESSGTG